MNTAHKTVWIYRYLIANFFNYTLSDVGETSDTYFNVDDSESNKKKKNKKKAFSLPHWCIYAAWVLIVLAVAASGFFVILYSFEWGSVKANEWLAAFYLSFIESVIIIQPIKVSCPCDPRGER